MSRVIIASLMLLTVVAQMANAFVPVAVAVAGALPMITTSLIVMYDTYQTRQIRCAAAVTVPVSLSNVESLLDIQSDTDKRSPVQSDVHGAAVYAAAVESPGDTALGESIVDVHPVLEEDESTAADVLAVGQLHVWQIHEMYSLRQVVCAVVISSAITCMATLVIVRTLFLRHSRRTLQAIADALEEAH